MSLPLENSASASIISSLSSLGIRKASYLHFSTAAALKKPKHTFHFSSKPPPRRRISASIRSTSTLVSRSQTPKRPQSIKKPCSPIFFPPSRLQQFQHSDRRPLPSTSQRRRQRPPQHQINTQHSLIDSIPPATNSRPKKHHHSHGDGKNVSDGITVS